MAKTEVLSEGSTGEGSAFKLTDALVGSSSRVAGLRASVPCLICLEAALSTLAGLVSPASQLASPEHAIESLARRKAQSFVTSSQKCHLLNVAMFCWIEASYSERRDYTKT